jgi:hypothetical protein
MDPRAIERWLRGEARSGRVASVVVVVGDERRPVAIPPPGRSGRWAIVARLALAADPDAVEVLDGDGGLLQRWVSEDADRPRPGDDVGAGPSKEVARLLELVLRAQRDGAEAAHRQSELAVSMMARVNEALLVRLDKHEKSLTNMVGTAYETARLAGEARAALATGDDSGAEDVLGQLLGMVAPHLLPSAPPTDPAGAGSPEESADVGGTDDPPA